MIEIDRCVGRGVRARIPVRRWESVAIAILTLAGAGPVAAQQRVPLLSQVKVPHAYYWREMYVPQPTSGPSSVAWMPNGEEVVFAMQGSIWRQRLGTRDAHQLTDGPTYDAQPDVSPDGRYVAFVSYDGARVDLMVLDLVSGVTTPLLANGAVNLEPRWSPDGSRLAFVSTMYEGSWHVYVANFGRASAPRLDTLVRITEHRNSGLPRYYYSVYDHYLSPTWSPDGRELIVVSNREHIYGTGGFWRMVAGPGASMRMLHYEETTWKAKPDWAPDGKRVVYSGYHGRQWNQLWLTTADGGAPIQLTYGDFDATAPRWAPDGRRVAYVSNEGGNTALRVVALPGAQQERVVSAIRHYRREVGRVRITVTDSATGDPLPVRVSVRASDGRFFTPDDAWRHGDEARMGGERFEYGYFHLRGHDSLTLPAGPTVVDVWHGPEFRTVRRELNVRGGTTQFIRIALARIDDLPRRGWWGGDLHVHMNYGGAYRNTPAHLAFQARAEGLHVVENLVVNKEQRIPDITYWRPTPDAVSTTGFLLTHGQEYHTGFWGHIALLGLRDHYLLLDYAGYPNTAAASLYPTNATVFDLGHAQGALTGYVHPFDFEPDLSKTEGGVPYELPIDVALGKVDYMEVMGYSDHLITSGIWYRLLNCGFRLPAGAGTDAFPNFATLRGPPGLVRVYAKSGNQLEHGSWLEAIKAGRTFVTNAPLLSFTLNGREPGAEIVLPPRGGARPRLRARVAVRSPVPLDHVEIVGNGRVVASMALSADGMRADTTVDVAAPEDGAGWFVVRARSVAPRLPVLDLYPFATTSPIYVRSGETRMRSRADADYFLRWIDRAEDGLRHFDAWNSAAERDEVMRLLAAARSEFEHRR